MTIYGFPNPRAAVHSILDSKKAEHWPTATISGAFPNSAITVPHIQRIWAGTPSQEQVRQVATMRITVWQPKGKADDAIILAQRVLAVLLDSGSATVWRSTARTPALVPGIDQATGLPFCTFNISVETRPAALT